MPTPPAPPQFQAPQFQPPPVQMQAPQMPQAPAAPKVPAAAPKAGPNILLIVIWCLVAFLLGAILILLLVKSK